MDLVKIGFQINANGLKDANTEVDKLLDKVDNIGTKGKKASSDFESSQKKVQDSVKKTEKVSTSASDKMIQKQQTINQLLPYMDKGVANLASSFWLVSKEAQSFNKFLDIMGEQDAIIKQKKQTEALVKEQEKQAKAVQSTIAKYEGLSNKSLGGGILDQIEQQNKGLEELRKQYQAEAKEANEKAESVIKAQEKQAKAVQDTVAQYENLSNKPLGNGILDQVEQQNKGLEELNKQYKDQEKEQQKALDDIETARQKHFSKVQKDYEKQQQAIVDTQQKAIDKQIASQNALNESNQKAIALEQAKAKYVSQGYGKTDATRLARLEVSGADVTTLNNYKSAIEATTRATQALNPAIEKATTSHSNFLGQIKGIAAYALLSTAIYGAMTATFNLIGATVRLADEYTSTQQRLKLYIKDSETLGQVNTFLAKSAIQNNVGLRENAALYAKLSPAMQRIGANTAATNQVVDAFGKSLRIGGATAMEAASATIQFAQAMASGKLAGDEFRSISEASPRFLKAIADGSGIAAEKLKEMSSAGALTTEVIARALVKEYHNLTRESESLGYTLEQGTNALKTGFMSLVGEFNEGAGITKYLGTSMADLGVSMIDGAKAAKENGEAVRVWFIRNADNISTLVDAFKLLSTVIISRYVAALVIARYENLRYQSALLGMAAAQAGVTRSTLAMTTALTVAGNAMKGLLAFFGGWVGLALTVVGTVAAYAMFNKESEKTTKSLQEEGESIEDVVAKYKELTKIQQEKALLDQRKSVEESTKAYLDQKDALLTAASRMKYFNEMTGFQSDVIDKLVLWYKDGKITLEQFSGAMKAQTSLTQSSKDKITDLASGVSEADKKAASASKVLEALGLATKGAGDEAEIAGSKYNKFLTDAETQININKLAAQYMVKHNLDQAKAVDLAKQALALQAQKKDITPAEIKSQQELLKSETALANITKDRADAEKKLNKEKKDDDKDLKKFSNMKLEAQTYYDVLQKVNNLEVARIASQKEYINIYKDNLAVATQIADMQERTSQAESRIEFEKSLRVEEEATTRIAALMKQGADYETAKAVANAKFTDDLRGREAAELSITNTLTAQAYALSDQITEQETLNKYLKEGMGIEEARFKVALSRIAKLSGGKNVYNEFGEDYENGMKSLRVKKATEASQIKINAVLRESGILTKAMEMGYTASNIAVAKLAGATQGLLFSQAEAQLKQQDELDLLYENAKARVKINSLLSGESETLREVKEDYATIDDFEAERAVQLRKSLELAESYVAKMKEQKANPLGDFSNIDFEVFGSFGNPFKEALDGLNSLISGSTKLDESLAIIATQISDLKTQSFVEDMFGNQTAVENLNSQVEKQVALEKDLQKQKAETNDIAYGQGLKFAKSFFKEGSKGYKVISGLEMALQAKKLAFAIWEKKDTISMLATKVAGYAKDAIAFVTGTATKIGAQMGLNVAQAQGAVAASANAPPPFGFASAAAMIALLAGIGIAISGGGSSGSFAPTNEGKGTVFGDKDAQSSSIKNSIEILSDNSELMLPLTSAMLSSLRNIESSIGGVTNLILRQATGSKLVGGVNQGFNANTLGKLLSNPTVGSLGGMIGGGALGATLGVSTLMGGLGMGAMGALAIAGPIGLAVGALLGPTLGKALGGLFGTKTTIKGQGLYGGSQDLGSIVSQGFNLQEYADVQTKKKTFGITTKTKNSTKFGEADGVLEKQFTSIFSGFYDSILASANSLGASTEDVKKKLQDSVVDLGKIDLKGLNGEQIQEKLEAVFGAAADNLAQQGFAGLDDFQQVGEGYYETLIRVASSVEQASYYTDRLNVSTIKYTDILNKQGDVAAEIVRQSVLLVEGNKNIKGGFYDLVNTFNGTAEEISDFVVELRDLQDQLFMTGKNADYLTSAMILGAGGLDSLASGFDAYFEMLSPAEQAAELTRRLTNEFAIFGKELPSDVKAFRNLVSGIDISTEAGQKLYGQVIALAPEFNDLQDSLKNANSEVNALVESLRDLAEQARAARGETEQPRNLAYTRSQFEQASVLAMQGDIASAEKLLTLGKDLMGLSKTYSVTGREYARDLALIQRAATVSADIQKQGLGTSISTTLTPSSGTTTTPIVNTNNTSTDARLDALSEKLEAGLFAIAKYTQVTATKLENWDDGNRIMVGVIQETGDPKLNVTVV